MSSNSLKVDDTHAAVSAFIICFNEQDFIEDCLKSLEFCDEIIVVDSFSSDRTVKICEKYGATVVQREWPGYKKQKEYGLSQCRNEWVLNLDADERISPELKESILSVLRKAKSNGNTSVSSGYEINRLVYFLDRWWKKGGWYPEYRLRLFQKKDIIWGGQDPHEKPICSGKVERLKGDIYHFTYADFEDQVMRLRKYAKIVAEQEYEAGARCSVFTLILSPLFRFLKFYFVKQGFREGFAGLIVAILEGYYTFLKYVFLWELEYESTKSKSKN